MYIDKKLMSVFEEYGLEFKKHRLNIIKAKCGTGKTYFFFNYLCKKYSKKRILYVVDTTHLKRTMKKRHNDIVSYDKTNIYRDKITIMSYHQYGYLLLHEPNFIKKYDLVVMDEAHNLMRYAQIGIDDAKRIADENIPYSRILEATSNLHYCSYVKSILPKLVAENETIFLMLTATPSKIYRHEPYKDILYDVLQGIELRGYITKLTIDYIDNYKNAITILQNHIEPGEKVLIYSKKIKACKQIKEELTKLGYNTEYLFSVNSSTATMNHKQLELRDYLIENEKYPDDLDILIINGAYETGWDLNDKRVQIVISNTYEIDVTTQARGRCRHDIRLLINKTHKAYDDKLIKILNKYTGKKLFTKDKTDLLEELGKYNRSGKLIGWTTFKKDVDDTEDFTIDDKGRDFIDGKQVRYDVIVKER